MENPMRLPLPRLLILYKSRFILFFVLFAGLAPHSALAQAPQPVETIMVDMLASIQNNSLRDFVAAGDPFFQNGMTQQVLDSIRRSLASRLKQGYTSTFLTKLNQQGFMVYLWKLEFKDKNDDVLVTMGIKDGEVSGFWLR